MAADPRCHAYQGASHGGGPAQKKGTSRCLGRTKGGLNAKLHAVCDGDLSEAKVLQGRERQPVILLLTEGQRSDHCGAALILAHLPPAAELIADRGIAASIPSRRSRQQPIPHHAAIDRARHRSEIMFTRRKDWRRIATRYDRCAHLFLAAISLAAAVTFRLPQSVQSLEESVACRGSI